MLVYLALDPQQSLASVPAYARRAERLGFDGLHVPETIHDSLAVALLALEHTTRLTVRTAVTLAFVRSPTAVAYAAWDLSVLSGGRFELGLGSQIKQNIRDRFAMEWTEPVERMRDYVGALQALFEAFRTGGSLNFEGAHYRLTRMQPYFNPGPSDALPPPIWLGAVNAGMSELAGEVAHGVVTHSTNSEPEHLRDVVRPALQRGAIASGRSAPAVVIASPAVATGVDDAAVRSALLNEFDLEIGAGLGALAGKTWRIGLMGYASNERNVIRCLSALEAVLARQGAAINTGAALSAAEAAFS